MQISDGTERQNCPSGHQTRDGPGEEWAGGRRDLGLPRLPPGPNKSTMGSRPRALSEVPAGGRELSAQ